MNGQPVNDAQRPDLAHRLARNFGWLSLQELAIRLLGLATAIYLARTLAAENYGALGLALAVVGFAASLVQSGTGSRATRLIARDPATAPEIQAQIAGFRIGMAIVLGALLVGFSGPIGRLFSVPPVLLVLCTLLLLRSCLTVAWAFRGLDRMHVPAAAEVGEKALTFLGLVLLVRGSGHDFLWAPVVEVGAALLMVGWMFRRLQRLYAGLRFRVRLRAWKETAREALPFGLANLVSSIYLDGGILLLGWLSTATAAAMLLVAQKVMLTLALLLGVIIGAAFPSISRLVHSDMPAALRLSARLVRYYLVLIVPAFLVVAFHADAVLRLLFGAQYAGAAPVLIILLAALPGVIAGSTLQMLLRALPRPSAVFLSRAAGAAVLLALAVALVPRLEATGAAIALAAGETVSTVLLFLFVRAATGGLPWDRYCLAPLLAGAAAALPYAMLAAWPIALRLPLAAAIYVGLVLALRGMTIGEARDFLAVLLATLRPGASRLSAGGGSENGRSQ